MKVVGRGLPVSADRLDVTTRRALRSIRGSSTDSFPPTMSTRPRASSRIESERSRLNPHNRTKILYSRAGRAEP